MKTWSNYSMDDIVFWYYPKVQEIALGRIIERDDRTTIRIRWAANDERCFWHDIGHNKHPLREDIRLYTRGNYEELYELLN